MQYRQLLLEKHSSKGMPLIIESQNDRSMESEQNSLFRDDVAFVLQFVDAVQTRDVVMLANRTQDRHLHDVTGGVSGKLPRIYDLDCEFAIGQ